MVDWLWLAICIVMGKLVYNLMLLWYCSTYQFIYLAFLEGSANSVYRTSKSAIILFKCARVQTKNPMYPAALEQFPTRSEPNATYILEMFTAAIIEYKNRCRETFSPLYWIKALVYLPHTLVYLPQKVFFQLGIFPAKSFINFTQLAWWVFAPVTILYLILQ